MPRSLVWLVFVGCSGDKVTDTPGETPETGTDDTDSPPVTTTTVPTPTGDPATIELGGACPLTDRYGGFLVEVLDYYSSIAGNGADAVSPIAVLEPVGGAGECQLWKRNNPFCDPPCGAGETCDLTGECVPAPVNQDLGAVTIGGLEQEVVMQPVVPGNTYFATQLPHPVFTADRLVELRTHGTTFGDELVLHGVGFDALTFAGDRTWLMKRDEALPVSWTPPTSALGRSRVELRISVDQHGLTPATIVCDFDDDGEAEVDPTTVTALMDLGVTGFPTGTLTRRTVDSAPFGDGCIDFELGSEVKADLSVDGYIPCDSPDDCPSGQTCDLLVGLCL
ncbi:MAG: hypothetical protein ABMA64_16840 [Myxococcota bacterium]